MEFTNRCKCVVDYKLLERAILHTFPQFPQRKMQRVSIYADEGGRRARIWIEGKNHIVCRLIIQYLYPEKLEGDILIHHQDKNPLNNSLENLRIMLRDKHSSIHSIDRRKSPYNSDKNNVISLYRKGYSSIQLGRKYNCSFTTILKRLQEWGIPRRRAGGAKHNE